MSEYFTARELAKICGTSERWVYKQSRTGKIPSTREGKRLRFNKQAVAKYFKKQSTGPREIRTDYGRVPARTIDWSTTGDFVTIKDVSDRFAISKYAIYRLVKVNCFPSTRLGGLRSSKTEIDKYLDRRSTGPRDWKEEPASGRFLTIKEAAEQLGMNVWLVRDRVKTHRLPAVRVGSAIRLRPEDIAGFIRRRDAGPEISADFPSNLNSPDLEPRPPALAQGAVNTTTYPSKLLTIMQASQNQQIVVTTGTPPVGTPQAPAERCPRCGYSPADPVPSIPDGELLNVLQVAKLLRLPEWQTYHLIAWKRIPSIRKSGRLRVRSEDISVFMKRNNDAPNLRDVPIESKSV